MKIICRIWSKGGVKNVNVHKFLVRLCHLRIVVSRPNWKKSGLVFDGSAMHNSLVCILIMKKTLTKSKWFFTKKVRSYSSSNNSSDSQNFADTAIAAILGFGAIIRCLAGVYILLAFCSPNVAELDFLHNFYFAW